MDAADPSSTSSKVIVQCTDPHDLFDKLSGSLESRLPLGNLHWKSPSRPLRSIDKLNVSFVREAKSRDSGSNVRRHQIPGLRQTPYVKLLLLRCDDRDNYKDTARKEVKEWLKRVGVTQDGKSLVKGQERHDAFEYIIVHVVVPGTPAAAQPKSAKHITQEALDSTDSVNSKSKWSGKSSTTVYDKLRADFGNVSKGTFERVAQVRITDSGVSASPLRPVDLEDLWQDLIEKLKAAILQSFDARVSQYEDDIRDRESQQSLPGWNFCTFFILKEGLARGFENVGLIEDALTVYDELDAGLDKIVQGQTTSGETDAAGSLLPFSQDLKPAIRKALDSLGDDEPNGAENVVIADLDALIDLEKKSFPLDNNAIDYQQRILTNQVSALDLRLYMYTRKLRLLFRKARNAVPPAKVKLGGTQYDVGKLSEICGQALEFISFASRALRQDLYAAWGGQQGLSPQELQTQELVIGNLVASWKVSAVLQVFEECQISQILSDVLVLELPSGRVQQVVTKHSHSTPILGGEQLNRHPYLQSPLDPRQSATIPLLPSPQPQREAPHIDSKERLALWAAEFLVVLRDIVKGVMPDAVRTDRPTSRLSKDVPQTVEGPSRKTSGLRSATLKTISTSQDASQNLYKMLTTYAYRCYKFANQMQASRQMVLSLGQMAYDEGQSHAATDWLEQIPDLLDVEAKTSTDLAILKLYLQCLDRDARPDEFTRCSISILQFSKTKLGSLAIQRAGIQLQDVLDDLVEASKHTQNYDLPFSSLFRVGALVRSITHRPDRDGFELSITIGLGYDLNLKIENNMVLTLQSTATEEVHAIQMNSLTPTTLSATMTSIQFVSQTTTFGWYVPSHVHVRLGNLHFIHTLNSLNDGVSTNRVQSALIYPIMVYPRHGSFSISSKPAILNDLTQSARVSVMVAAGDSAITNVSIRIKPATSGFRVNLHGAEMKTDDQIQDFQAVPNDGSSLAFNVSRLEIRQSFALDIPYTLENTYISTVQLRIEATYDCCGETFMWSNEERISIFLPINVNVQDIFQADATTLRFSAGPAAKVPLRIQGWEIEETELYELSRSSVSQDAVDAFPKLPANCVVRVKALGDIKPHMRNIKLTVRYTCTDELIVHAVTTLFKNALSLTDLIYLQPLLVPHLIDRISKLWTDDELEAVALTRQFQLCNFDDMQWTEIMTGVDQQTREKVESWLRSWHADHANVDISQTPASPRLLKLLVDIPQPTLVISSKIELDVSHGFQYLTIGKPVHATVNVTCVGIAQVQVEIHFDISAPTDVWLVGGKKRGAFRPTDDERKISLVLIPQKAGQLLLPAIDIRGRLANTNTTPDSFSCEIEHQDQAQSVLVVPGVYLTTTAVGRAADPGHHWLLESRSR